MKDYADVEELANHLRVAESTVRAWVRYLDMPVIRAGRLVRFDVHAVERWFESGGPTGLASAMRAASRRRRQQQASGTPS
jgi:excisionase family DNA binding protein